MEEEAEGAAGGGLSTELLVHAHIGVNLLHMGAWIWHSNPQ